MVGDAGLGIAEAAEVDDAAHAGIGGGTGEAPRRRDVALVEPFAVGHAVDEAVGDVDPGQSVRETSRPQYVAGRHLDVRQPVATLEAGRVTDQTTHAMDEWNA